jgi:hypothetical protein
MINYSDIVEIPIEDADPDLVGASTDPGYIVG